MRLLKKGIFFGIMAAMTASTIWAAKWQYYRYHQSVSRWNKIFNSLQIQPKPLPKVDFNNKQQQLDFTYISTKGINIPQTIFIDRSFKGKRGLLVLNIFKLDNLQKPFVVNQGWIPVQKKEQFCNLESSEQDIVGFLRKSQKGHQPAEQLRKKASIEAGSIQIDKIAKQKHLPLQKVYIEQLQTSKDDKYPKKYTVKNFQLPYLTPDKHQGYCIFWSSCSLLGIYSLIKIILL